MRLVPQTRQISLKDIHGIDVPFVWAQVTRPVDIDERSPSVLIIGSAVELEDRTVAVAPNADIGEQCRAIAEALACHRFNLVTDACPGIPNLIERAYLQQAEHGAAIDLSVLRSPHETDTTRAYSPTGFPSPGDVLLFCGSGFEILSILNTHCADLALVIGGGLGSLMEGIIAVINDLPIVCFSPSGGIAGEMQLLFERYRSRYKHLRITTCPTIDAFESFLMDFATDFRRRGGPSRLYDFARKLLPAPSSPLPDTEILIESELRHVSFTRGETSVQITDPVLLIDDARMMEETKAGAAIRSCLDTGPRQYCFDGMTVRVAQGIPPVVWCPSIDTYLMLRAMRRHLVGPYARALDIGTGTGVMALWMASRDQACSVVGIDKNPEAMRCASINASTAGMAERCSIRTTTYQRFRAEASAFDLVMCNPPYVPRLEDDDREDGSFDGVHLLVEVLSTLDRILTEDGVAFIALSSTSWIVPAVRDLMQQHISQGRASLIHEARLPFKVVDVLMDRHWLHHLLENGGLFSDSGDHYAYWHKMQVWRITRRRIDRPLDTPFSGGLDRGES